MHSTNTISLIWASLFTPVESIRISGSESAEPHTQITSQTSDLDEQGDGTRSDPLQENDVYFVECRKANKEIVQIEKHLGDGNAKVLNDPKKYQMFCSESYEGEGYPYSGPFKSGECYISSFVIPKQFKLEYDQDDDQYFFEHNNQDLPFTDVTYAELYAHKKEEDNTWYIDWFFVQPKRAKKGVGTAFYDVWEAHFATKHGPTIIADHAYSPAALAFWVKRGYHFDQERSTREHSQAFAFEMKNPLRKLTQERFERKDNLQSGHPLRSHNKVIFKFMPWIAKKIPAPLSGNKSLDLVRYQNSTAPRSVTGESWDLVPSDPAVRHADRGASGVYSISNYYNGFYCKETFEVGCKVQLSHDAPDTLEGQTIGQSDLDTWTTEEAEFDFAGGSAVLRREDNDAWWVVFQKDTEAFEFKVEKKFLTLGVEAEASTYDDTVCGGKFTGKGAFKKEELENQCEYLRGKAVYTNVRFAGQGNNGSVFLVEKEGKKLVLKFDGVKCDGDEFRLSPKEARQEEQGSRDINDAIRKTFDLSSDPMIKFQEMSIENNTQLYTSSLIGFDDGTGLPLIASEYGGKSAKSHFQDLIKHNGNYLFVSETRAIFDRMYTFFQRVAKAMRIMHESGWVHLDIHDQNILVKEVNGDDQVMIIDYGRARKIDINAQPAEGFDIKTARHPIDENFGRRNGHYDLYQFRLMLDMVFTEWFGCLHDEKFVKITNICGSDETCHKKMSVLKSLRLEHHMPYYTFLEQIESSEEPGSAKDIFEKLNSWQKPTQPN